MLPKYEEKTFESYFNNELDRRSRIYFPFGQVQEGSIGADSAAWSQNRWLWERLGYPFYYPGIAGADLPLVAQEMEHYLKRRIQNIPAIKANLLFQYKRPEVITTANGAEWSHWKQRYFRYGIYAQQQKLLHHLDQTFGSKALILYASPALADVNELVKAKLSGKIIETTNFTRVAGLQGHHRNTYVRAGLHSIACSEPEELPALNLLATLEQLEDGQAELNVENVLAFTSSVRGAVEYDDQLGGSFRSLLRPFQEQGIEEYNLMFAHIAMSIVREITGVQWLIAVGAE